MNEYNDTVDGRGREAYSMILILFLSFFSDQRKAIAIDGEEKRDDRQMGRQMGVVETE